VIAKIVKGAVAVFLPSALDKKFYLDALKMLNEMFQYARKHGVVKLESDVEAPSQSAVFKKYPAFLKNHHAVDFVCDTLRMFITGGVNAFDLDQMMEIDIEVHHHDQGLPVSALTSAADSLPGLGIVAAVLGVVITMGALGGPPEEIGHKVAAALVGTFLGILLCYGFAGPLASHMDKLREAESCYYRCLRVGIMAFVRGDSPILAVEFARRAIPGDVRPSFKEMEGACRGPSQVAVAAQQERRWKNKASLSSSSASLSSSSGRKPPTAVITAARGKSLTPISSPR